MKTSDVFFMLYPRRGLLFAKSFISSLISTTNKRIMSLTPNSSSISLLTASTHSADALTNSANDTYMNHFVRFQSHYHNQKDGEQHTFNVPNECCLPLTCSQHSSCKFVVARKCQYNRYNFPGESKIYNTTKKSNNFQYQPT